MTAQTYTDALGATKEWINSRDTLVGPGKPLQLGAHLKKVQGATPACYAYLETAYSARSGDCPESPDLMAALSAQVYGGTLEAATGAAVALAEELSTALNGVPAVAGPALLMVVDDLQGPAWFPDGDLPRLILNFTVRARPI